MEVLFGNQPSSKHSRRRSDQVVIGDNRSLDWGTRDSDIVLFPQSPLTIAKALLGNSATLDLIPRTPQTTTVTSSITTEQATGHSDPHQDSPLSVTIGKPSEQTAANAKTQTTDEAEVLRANLFTQHNDTELLAQCKKILVENALVKNKGERQLYLAAGFISWPDNQTKVGRKRAPLLFYPALLVRTPNESRYEIRISGDTPEFNLTFKAHAEQCFSIELPEYRENTELSRYFQLVSQAVSGNPLLAFEQEIAIGSAAILNSDIKAKDGIELPDIPKHFDVGLAMSITGNKSLSQLNAVLQLIPNYSSTNLANEDADNKLNPQPESVARLRQYAARLAAEGLDHIDFKQLATLPSMIRKWSDNVQQGLASATIKRVLNVQSLSARELIRLSSIIELIDKAPTSVDSFAHPDLCYKTSTVLLQRAQHQAKLIEDELTVLQSYFILEQVPSKSQLLTLISELGKAIDSGSDLVGADYFNARRQFLEFSKQKPTHLAEEHRRLLSQLAKVIRFRELYVNNTEYRTALGPAYKGLRTDWNTLNQVSTYSRELAEVLESTTIAARILKNWPDFRRQYGVELDTLQTSADSCRRLLKIVGTRWQSQPVSALLNHALLIRSRLKEWRKTFGSIEHHADKTASIVLSSFSGKSRDDVIVETHVDETRSRIDEQLLAGELDRQRIHETLMWLKAASTTAAEHEMSIDAIVGHLQIA